MAVSIIIITANSSTWENKVVLASNSDNNHSMSSELLRIFSWCHGKRRFSGKTTNFLGIFSHIHYEVWKMLSFKNLKSSILLETSSSNETILSNKLKRRLQSHQFGAFETSSSMVSLQFKGAWWCFFNSVNFKSSLIHKNVRKTTSVKDDPSPVHAPQFVHFTGDHRRLLYSLKPQMRGMARSQKAKQSFDRL